MKRATVWIVVVLAAAALGSCGRKAVPRLPAGAQDQYPHGYPKGAPPTHEPIFVKPGPGPI
jgi:hypothetical protein